MTENEAIKRVEEFGLYHAIGDLPRSTLTVKAFEMAIKALQEIQQYRAIGTVWECREAMERQWPKKPLQGEPYTWIDSVKVKGRYRDVRKTSYSHVCSNCGKNVAMDMSCCKYCGQAIDWSDND